MDTINTYIGGSPDKQEAFGHELRALLNRHSLENDSNTPDIVLATYLRDCLSAFNCSVRTRENLSLIADIRTQGLKL